MANGLGRDLTESSIRRQNILNNGIALASIAEELDLQGVMIDGEYYFTKQMVAAIYGVDARTIERCVASNREELRRNGYFVSSGKSLEKIRLQLAPDIPVGIKTRRLSLFSFRAVLNVGMLLTSSERAKQMRALILDITLRTINQRSGGGTKYINRRDAQYLPSAIREANYHERLTSAIKRYVAGSSAKFEQISDIIYRAIFGENAQEYREILKLAPSDNVRHTLYAEVLLVVSSFEAGVAAGIGEAFRAQGDTPLSVETVAQIVTELANTPAQQPYLHDARAKMASRDYSFRDAYHHGIAEYINAVTEAEYNRFLGDESVDFDRILEENRDVLERLK